jgi:hypothetical protein
MTPMHRLAGLFFVAVAGAAALPAVAAEAAKPEYDFIQIGRDAAYGDGVLVLHGIGTVTTYIAERPSRAVGEIPHTQFVAAWMAAAPALTADPPNVAISFIDDRREAVVAIAELGAPVLAPNEIRYTIKLLHGQLPQILGPTTLFIDSGGLLPLGPAQ